MTSTNISTIAKFMEELRSMPKFGVLVSATSRTGMSFVEQPICLFPMSKLPSSSQELTLFTPKLPSAGQEKRLLAHLKKRPIGEFIYNLSNKSLL